jgi:hypothetical protein
MTDPSNYDPRVWERPDSPSDAEVFKGFGGVVAPLLAGFSLASIVGLLTGGSVEKIPLLEYAIVGFALTTVLLLFAIQFSFLAVRHHVSPVERLAWRPEATVDRDVLEDERWVQLLDMKLARTYSGRAANCYNLGLLSFTAALLLVLIPSEWTIGRGLAVVVAAGGGIVEVLWITAGQFPFIRKWLLPEYGEAASGEVRPGDAMLGSVLQSGDRGSSSAQGGVK